MRPIVDIINRMGRRNSFKLLLFRSTDRMASTSRIYTFNRIAQRNNSGTSCTRANTPSCSKKPALSLRKPAALETTSWYLSGWRYHCHLTPSLAHHCHSCGFDASEHEYPSMSRHHRHVPTSFYRQFALDTRRFAERFARGRLISVLEGGYSDRALTSGAMAHLVGLVDNANVDCETWWSLDNLIEVGIILHGRC